MIFHDQRTAKLMLDYFEKQAYDELDKIAGDLEKADIVSLVPMISKDDKSEPFLSFTVGRGRKYVIKNIYEFINNVRDEKIVAYGKNLEFKHKLSMFDTTSQKLIEMLMNEFDQAVFWGNDKYSVSFNYDGTMINKIVVLTPRIMDKLFDIYEGSTLGFVVQTDDERSVILDSILDPQIKYSIDYDEAKMAFSITSNLDEMWVIKGEAYGYILKGDILHRVSSEYFKTVYPLIRTLSKVSDNRIVISRSELERFMTFLYPRLKDGRFLERDIDFDAVELGFSPLIKKLYFDTAGKDIKCTVLFCYGDMEINPLVEKDVSEIKRKGIIRNKLEEYKLIQRLEFLGFKENKQGGWFVLDDEDLIYDFYYAPSGLEFFKEQNETYATDEFLKKSFKPKVSVSFGVRLAGNLLEISLENEAGFSINELLAVLKSYNVKKRYHRLNDGTFLSLEDKDNGLGDADRLISALGLSDKDIKKGSITVPKYRTLYLSDIAEDGGSTIRLDESVKRIRDDFSMFMDMPFEIPKQLDGVLRNYQKEGFKWLNAIAHYNFGGILADDMGLGKTLQVISVLLAAKKKEKKPSIVVAPTSLIYNWENEIIKFAPELKAVPVIGLPVKRREILGDGNNADVYITTYDVLKKDIENYKEIEFEYIIADEAQNIKNPATQNARAIKQLDGRVRFALTGTPVENTLSELWSIFDFIMPGYLYNHSRFLKHYESPIIKNNDSEKSDQLRRMISPFILRRLKSDVLKELPEKIETTMYSDMTAEQKKLYTAYLFKARGDLEENVRNGTFNTKRMDVLAQLIRLRQICCHPSVFITDYKGGSGKLELTIETIQNSLESGHRVLLFSQFTSMLEIIKTRLDKENIEYFYLDGSTDSKKRVSMADCFNSGIGEVFLISLKAGGTGLNITGADVVIHFDQWWNPAVMDQASDRAHRIGQKRTVQVINIVAKDSIEERILELQARKKDLIDNVITDGGGYISAMTQEEIMSLFSDN